MMPLILANVGEENVIKKIGGSPEVKQHLENLGFVEGETVRVVSDISGNLIVQVKDPRCGKPRNGAKNNDINLIRRRNR